MANSKRTPRRDAGAASVFEQLGLTPERTRGMSLVEIVRQCMDYSQRLTDELRAAGCESPSGGAAASPSGAGAAAADAAADAAGRLRDVLEAWPARDGGESARLMQPRTFLESLLFVTEVTMSTVDMAMCLEPGDFFPAPLLYAAPAAVSGADGTAAFDLQHRAASLLALMLTTAPAAVYAPFYMRTAERGAPSHMDEKTKRAIATNPAAPDPDEGIMAAPLRHGDSVLAVRNYVHQGVNALARAVLRYAPPAGGEHSRPAPLSHADILRSTLPARLLRDMAAAPRPDLAARAAVGAAQPLAMAELGVPSAAAVHAHWLAASPAERASLVGRELARLVSAGAVPRPGAPADVAPCSCGVCALRVLRVTDVVSLLLRAYHHDLEVLGARVRGEPEAAPRLRVGPRCRVRLYAALERLADEAEDCRGNGLVSIMKRIRRIVSRRAAGAGPDSGASPESGSIYPDGPNGACTSSTGATSSTTASNGSTAKTTVVESGSGSAEISAAQAAVYAPGLWASTPLDESSPAEDADAHDELPDDDAQYSDDEDMEAFYEDFTALEDEDVLEAEGDLPVDAALLPTAFPALYYAEHWAAPGAARAARPALLDLAAPRGADGPQLYAVVANVLLTLSVAPEVMRVAAGARTRAMLAELEAELLGESSAAPSGGKSARKRGRGSSGASTPRASSGSSMALSSSGHSTGDSALPAGSHLDSTRSDTAMLSRSDSVMPSKFDSVPSRSDSAPSRSHLDSTRSDSAPNKSDSAMPTWPHSVSARTDSAMPMADADARVHMDARASADSGTGAPPGLEGATPAARPHSDDPFVPQTDAHEGYVADVLRRHTRLDPAGDAAAYLGALLGQRPARDVFLLERDIDAAAFAAHTAALGAPAGALHAAAADAPPGGAAELLCVHTALSLAVELLFASLECLHARYMCAPHARLAAKLGVLLARPDVLAGVAAGLRDDARLLCDGGDALSPGARDAHFALWAAACEAAKALLRGATFTGRNALLKDCKAAESFVQRHAPPADLDAALRAAAAVSSSAQPLAALARVLLRHGPAAAAEDGCPRVARVLLDYVRMLRADRAAERRLVRLAAAFLAEVRPAAELRAALLALGVRPDALDAASAALEAMDSARAFLAAHVANALSFVLDGDADFEGDLREDAEPPAAAEPPTRSPAGAHTPEPAGLPPRTKAPGQAHIRIVGPPRPAEPAPAARAATPARAAQGRQQPARAAPPQPAAQAQPRQEPARRPATPEKRRIVEAAPRAILKPERPAAAAPAVGAQPPAVATSFVAAVAGAPAAVHSAAAPFKPAAKGAALAPKTASAPAVSAAPAAPGSYSAVLAATSADASLPSAHHEEPSPAEALPEAMLIPSNLDDDAPPRPHAGARAGLSGEAPPGAAGWFDRILGPAMGSLWSPLAGLEPHRASAPPAAPPAAPGAAPGRTPRGGQQPSDDEAPPGLLPSQPFD